MNLRAYTAEFVGTFALIFIGVAAIASAGIAKDQPGLVAIALAHGLTIAAMASATMAISGGHLNPAVTLGALSAGKITPLKAAGYWISQFLGALVAALLVQVVLPSAALHAVDLGTPAPGSGISGPQALLMEAVLTFFLMFVIYGTAIDGRAPRLAGLFVGLTVTLDILAGGPITGAAMNPARWLGPALAGGGGLGNFWIYFFGPAAGAVGAALLWRRVLERSELCNDVIMSAQSDPAAISAWFASRLPAGWFNGPAVVAVVSGGVQVVGTLPAVELPAGSEEMVAAAAAAGRIARFREDTRPQRIEIAQEAEARFGLPVTWGATCGEASLLFTPGGGDLAAAGPGPAWGRRGDFVRV